MKKNTAPQTGEKTDNKKTDRKNNSPLVKEVGGREGPEPTRYGDWENNGIISDF